MQQLKEKRKKERKKINKKVQMKEGSTCVSVTVKINDSLSLRFVIQILDLPNEASKRIEEYIFRLRNGPMQNNLLLQIIQPRLLA